LPRQLVAPKFDEGGSMAKADLSRRSEGEDGSTDHHSMILTKSVNFFPV
jgi:hypothetical protein